MTKPLSGQEIAEKITENFPGALVEADDTCAIIDSGSLLPVVSFLKDTAGLDFDYLSTITAVDYFDYFELVYLLTSMKHNHSLVLKTRCYGRENLSVPSIVSLYEGANAQEREIYDLMGIGFEGHPNMKRLFLWEGFQGHPLRKDYL